MKNYRSILFSISIFLLSLVLVINPLNIRDLPVAKVNAQSLVRPYVVFVNGYRDCCTWGRYTNGNFDPYMDIVVQALPPNSEIRYVPWDSFENGANQRSSTSNDAEFLRQATNFINQLDPNRPLILIGHSFGGDSLISLVPRITRRIQFLGVIDPTAAGGLREPVTRRGIPSNVDYFFNRWQKNGLNSSNVVPFDSRLVNGSISGCRAGSCDQSEQNLARNQDGSEIRVSCNASEVTCDGWRLPGCNFSGCWSGSNGTKAKRLAHNDMPFDKYLQRQMADQISNVLISYEEGTLIRNSSGAVWRIEGGYKRGIIHGSIFAAYKFDPKAVRLVPDNIIRAIPDGTLMPYPDNTLIRNSTGTVWHIEGGLKRGIISGEVFDNCGFDRQAILDGPDEFINNIPEGALIGVTCQ